MPVILSSALLAFCGLSYELVLAQTLTVLLGNSFLQYGLTIGLFMAGMGWGALLSDRDADPSPALIKLQTALCAFVPAGYLLLWTAALFLPSLLIWAAACGLVFAIGLLTGKELPLLMRLAGKGSEFPVLAADYAGMLAACVLFPYWLLPRLGLFGTLTAAAVLNGLSIQFLLAGQGVRRRLAFSALPVALVILALYQDTIWQWFSRQYISAAL